MALSCVNHTAFIYDRGGVRKVVDLSPLSRVRWGRIRDTISVGTAWVNNPSLKCRQELGMVEAGRHELVIFRGKHRVWEGPITRITYRGGSVEFEAKDVMHYVHRTIMRNEYDNRYPNNGLTLDRINRIMTAEMARKEALDPPINVLKHTQYLYSGDGAVFPGRYYNNSSALATQVRGAKDIAQINAALEPMRKAYGFGALGVAGASTGEYGIHWTTPQMRDYQIKESVVAGVLALAKYPPEFFRALGLSGFWFAKNLRSDGSPAGWNIGGLAVDRKLFIDIMDLETSTSLEYIIHHELNHLMWNHYASSQAQMTADWMACNPPGFTYSGNNYMNPPVTGEHPTGFTRDYGRSSVMEDIAEVAGAVMSKSTQADLKRWIAGDSYLARKVALYKSWIGRVSGGLVGPEQEYFDAVNSGSSVTVTGPSGLRDVGTAAHTLPYEMSVFEHIDNYAQRGGIDYTVLGRSILFFDVRKNIGQTPKVTADDFLGDMIITQYGMELATYVAHTDGKGHYGDAGGPDPYYGDWELLHQAYDEEAERDGEEVPDVSELRSQARRTWNQSKRPPLVARVPDNTTLNPNGVLVIEDLVPGVLIPLTATLPGRSVSQMQKLDSMNVEESKDGESITVTLSAAPGEEYTEEDEGK